MKVYQKINELKCTQCRKAELYEWAYSRNKLSPLEVAEYLDLEESIADINRAAKITVTDNWYDWMDSFLGYELE